MNHTVCITLLIRLSIRLKIRLCGSRIGLSGLNKGSLNRSKLFYRRLRRSPWRIGYRVDWNCPDKTEIKFEYRQINTDKYALKTMFSIFHACLYLSVCIQGLNLSVCICMYRLYRSLSVCTRSGTTPTRYNFSLFHIFCNCAVAHASNSTL